MKPKSVVCSGGSFVCPATNMTCRVMSCTVRIKAPDIMQMPLVDADMTRYAAMNDDQLDAVNQKLAEADRDG